MNPADPGKPVQVSLNFMPAFYAKHTGTKYGEAYYLDPSYRAEVERAEGRFLYEILGRYGVGSPDPHPSTCLFIQPADIVMGTQGAEWRFPIDSTIESWGNPWAGRSVEEIARINPAEAAHHPVIDAVLRQYHELEKLYGDRADIFWIKSGIMNIHTPYTTAHKLCGEELLVQMMTEPDDATRILEKVWEIYRAIYARIEQETHARATRIQLGDCSAALLSPSVYRRVVLPMNRKIARRFDRVGYHSCGPSSHLIEAFRELPHLQSIELGPGTDLTVTRRLMPDLEIRPLVDPKLVLNANPDEIRAMVATMLHQVAGAPSIVLCAWSFDGETPIPNVQAIYAAAFPSSHSP